MGLCLAQKECIRNLCIFFRTSEQIRWQGFYSTCRMIMKILFFSWAKNIESLLKVEMNIAYKGSISGIVHFFKTKVTFLSSFQVYAYSKVHLSGLSIFEPRFLRLDLHDARMEFRGSSRVCQLTFERYYIQSQKLHQSIHNTYPGHQHCF